VKLSTKGRYALRSLVDLVEQERSGLTNLKSIAERQKISVKYLEALFTILRKKHILKSSRGAQGGYSLAKPAEAISVYDILCAIEGNFDRFFCNPGKKCKRFASCRTRPFWQGVNTLLRTHFEKSKLSDFLDPVRP